MPTILTATAIVFMIVFGLALLLPGINRRRRVAAALGSPKTSDRSKGEKPQILAREGKGTVFGLSSVPRIPLLKKPIADAVYLGLGPLAVPIVVGSLGLAWPLAVALPVDLVPFAVPLFLAILIVRLVLGIVLDVLATHRRQRIEGDIKLLLDGLARGLRVGKPFSAALRESTDILSSDMQRAIREIEAGIAVGYPASEMVSQQAEKLKVKSLDFLAAVLRADESSGGGMAKAVENLASLIRERHDLNLMAASKTSQGRMTGNIMAAMPIGMMVVLGLSASKQTEHLYDTVIGNIVFCIAIALVLGNVAVVRKLSTLRSA